MDCLQLNTISAFIAHAKHMMMTGNLREFQAGGVREGGLLKRKEKGRRGERQNGGKERMDEKGGDA